tara:strand:- start:621 stop:914 length:294 start_codon:yes stop_codon:yes gene_type:complete
MTNKIMEEGVRNYWNRIAREMLVGRQIFSVRYMHEDECGDMDWHNSPVVIGLSNRISNKGEKPIYLYPSQDDEGNGAGSIFTTVEDNPILPVIRSND